MQNKPFRLLMLASTVTFFNLPLWAQVNIGDDVAPNRFSLLEINVLHQSGGLRLPQLTAAQCDSLSGVFTSPTTSTADKAAAQGLVVFNTGNGCVEFWSGDSWVSLCDDSSSTAYVFPSPACEPPPQPGPITGSKYASPNMPGSVTYSVPAVDGLRYTWSLPVGWSGSSTSASITPTLTNMAESGTISVTASNGACSSKPSNFNVIVGRCGAYLNNEWRIFMCWNLGANYNADPFTPSKDLNGDYYVWGSDIPVARATDPPYPIPGSTGYYPLTWYGGSGDVTLEMTTEKSAYDPCPPGYRVPNMEEWTALFAENEKDNKGDWATYNDASSSYCLDCWAGAMFGGSLYLPAAGLRGTIGELYARGYLGDYWTATAITKPNDYTFVAEFTQDAVNDVSERTEYRGTGFSIRCIKE